MKRDGERDIEKERYIYIWLDIERERERETVTLLRKDKIYRNALHLKICCNYHVYLSVCLCTYV